MRGLLGSIVALALVVGSSCAATETRSPEVLARTARLAADAFENAEVTATESTPPTFEVVLTKKMPSPGFKFEIDSLTIDEKMRRIVVDVTATRSPGIRPSVMTATRLRIPLGSLEPADYMLEIRTRRDPQARHRWAQAMVIHALP